MDSDDSSAASSTSSPNSSANSDESRPSSPPPATQDPPSPASSIASSNNSRSRSVPNSKTVSNSSPYSSEDEEEHNDTNNFSENFVNMGIKNLSPNLQESHFNRIDDNNIQNDSPMKSPSQNSNMSSIDDNNGKVNSENQENDVSLDRFRSLSHEDLSDVSEMDCDKNIIKTTASSNNSEDESKSESEKSNNETVEQPESLDNVTENNAEKSIDEEPEMADLRQKLDQKKSQLKSMNLNEQKFVKCNGNGELDVLVKKHDEDALDFEAEEGECQELSKDDDPQETEGETSNKNDDKEKKDPSDELEEGEVTDEEEKRPEETEPKPICRFYTRGQCTWGMSCRFLHPGVTDKGNYTMFDMVRSVPVPPVGSASFRGPGFHDYRTERPPLHHRPPIHHHPAYVGVHHDARATPTAVQEPLVPVVESAWERGLRTAKEMMRKANKRKEQDMDFEDKKMNLSLSQEELEKDNYYTRDRASPDITPPYTARHATIPSGHFETYSPPNKYNRNIPGAIYEEDLFGRTARYRELPPHRMPHYEDERRIRPAREVIVQRAEPVGRGDEWNDPWMRSKSPHNRSHDNRYRSTKRTKDGRRSYSSNSSYSSTSSSRSDSSSDTSVATSPETKRRRYNSTHSSRKSLSPRRHIKTSFRSPSPKRRRSPSVRRSPLRRRLHASPTISEKRLAVSPIRKRKNVSPPLNKPSFERGRKKRKGISTSGSETTETSGSGSDTSCTSSSDTSSGGKTPVKRPGRQAADKSVNERKIIKKTEITKKRSPISIEIKKPQTLKVITPENLSSSATSKKATRREELLKQLRAVEDAIARKRLKIN